MHFCQSTLGQGGPRIWLHHYKDLQGLGGRGGGGQIFPLTGGEGLNTVPGRHQPPSGWRWTRRRSNGAKINKCHKEKKKNNTVALPQQHGCCSFFFQTASPAPLLHCRTPRGRWLLNGTRGSVSLARRQEASVYFLPLFFFFFQPLAHLFWSPTPPHQSPPGDISSQDL